MNERGWFTLMVRTVGLYLLASGVLQLMPVLTNVLRQGFPARSAASTGSGVAAVLQMNWVWQGLGPTVMLAMGLYLFFSGGWIIDKLCREVVDRCRRCGYDLRQAPGGICPECGTALKPPEQPGKAAP